MNARARAGSLGIVKQVTPSWLADRLEDPSIRILDVRTGPSDRDATATRLRGAKTVDLRRFAIAGAADGWKASPIRHSKRRGPPRCYLDSHVPGAVSVDVRELFFDDDGEVVGAPEIALAMSGLGVGDEHTVVFVDDGRAATGLAAAWVLRRFGHTNVYLLEGGFTAWLGAGHWLSREVVRHAPASFTAKVS